MTQIKNIFVRFPKKVLQFFRWLCVKMLVARYPNFTDEFYFPGTIGFDTFHPEYGSYNLSFATLKPPRNPMKPTKSHETPLNPTKSYEIPLNPMKSR